MLGLLELVRLGGDEIIEMAKNGTIRGRHLWVAIKGAETYRRAVAAGDLRPVERAKTCARVCAGCNLRTVREVEVNGTLVVAGYCGKPFEVVKANPKKGTFATCGCLVTMTFGGELLPAGKAVVQSERCPNELWPD